MIVERYRLDLRSRLLLDRRDRWTEIINNVSIVSDIRDVDGIPDNRHVLLGR